MYTRDMSLELSNKSFFYGFLHRFFFTQAKYEDFLFAFICTQNITRFLFGSTAILFIFSAHPLFSNLFGLDLLITGSFFVIISLFFGEYLPRLIGLRHPQTTYILIAPIASLFLLAAFPIIWISIKFLKLIFGDIHLDHLKEPMTRTKQEIYEMIHKSRVESHISNEEKRLIESVLTFKDRIAREIMVPRVELFILSSETSIREAAKLIDEEGFSRIPIYEETVDNIVGVVMYKDLIKQYMEYEKTQNNSILDAPVKSIQKSVFYIPETKKISILLQEFRKKQVHMAIIVDEYGGTEGVVTIEDILEEIVGEISDEYDEEEELFIEKKEGHWIVDPRMSIIDAEEQLGIKIPQEGDYDTIGGYIFHSTGTIPPKGLVIHQENFDLEILNSDERRVEKVLIKRRSAADDEREDDNR
ncbi:MAG: hemolysin family protein [Waddliaceae bacterium]